MIAIRIVVYAIVGAVLAAAVLYGFQLYILHAAHASLAGVGLRTLLIDVMDLPTYAAFGGVLGALLAPFPGRDRSPVVRLLAWTGVGILAGLAGSFVRLIRDLGHIPTMSEVTTQFTVDPKFLIAGTAVGLLLSWVETGVQWVQHARLRRRLARSSGGSLNDVDAALKAYWRQRADAYLAERGDHR